MGPRRIRRGEPGAGSGPPPAPRRCFNGATANSPWRTPCRSPRCSGCSACFNGATANSPWRTDRLRGFVGQVHGLQWGHGEFAVENAPSSPVTPPGREASMGPRRIRRGEHRSRFRFHRPERQASMGPRRIRRGERRRPARAGAEGAASMGPRRIRRGELRSSWPVTSRGKNCFNGATANSPWRTMRSAACPRRPRRGFNGATANSPWRTTVAACVAEYRRKLLQWGHGEFAVENERALETLKALADGASMGPRRIRRGERGRCARDDPGAVLQWGHGEFAVENDLPCPVSRRAAAGFNGATANSPWRTRDVREVRSGERPASMGPRRIRRGEPELEQRWHDVGGDGFNGATANSPWRTQHLQDEELSAAQASMGPRRIRRGEQLRRGHRRAVGQAASMGPRRIRRGEPRLGPFG